MEDVARHHRSHHRSREAEQSSTKTKYLELTSLTSTLSHANRRQIQGDLSEECWRLALKRLLQVAPLATS
jgi:hypothetical protein